MTIIDPCRDPRCTIDYEHRHEGGLYTNGINRAEATPRPDSPEQPKPLPTVTVGEMQAQALADQPASNWPPALVIIAFVLGATVVGTTALIMQGSC